MTRGRFITLEGGEGGGKSTQIKLLATALAKTGIEMVTTREPGGSPGAEDIRTLLVTGEPGRWEPSTELLLFSAARRDHVSRTIEPALARGAWVLCDRFADSTMAYQGYGHELGREVCEAAHRLALGNFQPDLTLILDLPPEVGLARTRARAGGETRFERMGLAFHRRLREGFLDIAKREPSRCHVINADSEIESVQVAIRAIVARHFTIAL